MISFGLDEEQQIIQDTVRKFAAEAMRPRMRELEAARAIPATLRRQFHELGLGLIDVPEAAGGQGAGLTTAALVHEELAFGDPGVALALWAPHLAAQALLCLGDAEQQKRWLGRFADSGGGERTGAVAYSERSAPIEGFSTVARPEGDHFVLNGQKAFVVNGGTADVTVVFAQLEGTSGWDGAAAFVVAADLTGLRAGARHALLGLEAVDAREIVLEGCRVPVSHRLVGGDNFRQSVMRMFGRWGVVHAARQVGLARAAYEVALEFTQERKAFGKPVAHFQSVAFTLADMHMDVESARWLVWKAASELDRNPGSPTASASVIEAVVHANEAAWRVADNGVQLLGGAGYVKDYPVEKWLRDTKTLALFGPPSEAAQLGLASLELGHAIGGGGLPSTGIQPFFT